MDKRYTATIYVAAPGTPLASGGTSAAGHVYYPYTTDMHQKAMDSLLPYMANQAGQAR